ncbi:MAG: DUF2029 domain-containing protein [Planctomycetes bacterium]|nr:DUF2029 domain-containing protein [Planctomycetota bacterium]
MSDASEPAADRKQPDILKRLRSPESWVAPAGVLVAILALVLAGVGAIAFVDWTHIPRDILAYWSGGTNVIEGNSLYGDGPNTIAGRPYLYPPAFAAFFSFFVRLGPRFGTAVWGATHLLFAALLFRELYGWARTKVDRPGTGIWLALLLLVVLFQAFWTEQWEGQVNTLVALLVFGGLLRVTRGREITGAVMLALAIHVKVLPAVLVLLLLLQKRNRAALATLGFCLLFTLAPALVSMPKLGVFGSVAYAFHCHIDWLTDVMWPALTKGSVAGTQYYAAPNLSLRAVGYRWFVDDMDTGAPLLFGLPFGLVRAVSLIASVGLAGVSLWMARRTKDSTTATIVWATTALFALQIGNLLYWDHHLMLMALPVAALFVLALREGGSWKQLVPVVPLALLTSGARFVQLTAEVLEIPRDSDLVRDSQMWGFPLMAALLLVLSAGKYLLPARKTEPETADATD